MHKSARQSASDFDIGTCRSYGPAPQPRSKKTPSGGRMMAKMILMISLEKMSAALLCVFSSDGAQLPAGERHGERGCLEE